MSGRNRLHASVLQSAGAEAEWLIAKTRVALVLLLLITPTYKVIVSPQYPVYFWGFVITVSAAFVAIGFVILLRHVPYNAIIGFCSSVTDISLISSSLALFMFLGYPLVSLNSKVTFEIYFLAILTTSLRFDRRICIGAGAVAVLQYSSMWIYAQSRWDLVEGDFNQASLGAYSLVDQITRSILLCAAVILAYVLVRRGQRLLFLAIHDPLTGLYNRAHFETHVAHDLRHAERYKKPFSIAVIDADHFKQINDRFGHAAGDRVLVAISTLIRENIRAGDMAVRYGGEEFVLLFSETSPPNIHDRLENLRSAVESLSIPLQEQDSSMQVTISIGLAGYPDDATTSNALLEVADQRLLRAKEQGRNRIVGPPGYDQG